MVELHRLVWLELLAEIRKKIKTKNMLKYLQRFTGISFSSDCFGLSFGSSKTIF